MTTLKELVGKRIKIVRKRCNLTQEKLAELIDIGTRQISRLECGGNFPSHQTFEKLSRVLGVETMEFFNFEDMDIAETQIEKPAMPKISG